jgi:hypothetical protein
MSNPVRLTRRFRTVPDLRPSVVERLPKRAIGVAVCSVMLGLFCGCRAPAPEISAVDYHGWDAVRLNNGKTEAVVVPGIARVMAFGRKGGPNLIWQDAALWGKGVPLSSLDFQNYGGAKLWVAPQSVWGWPPDPAMDRGACELDLSVDGDVRLTGMPSPVTGVRLGRSIRLASDEAALDLQYTVQNTTTSNVSWGIWNVIQLQPGGRVLIPVPEGTRLWEHRDWSILDDWTRKGDVLVLNHTGKEGKVHTIGPEGWVAYEKDGEVFVLTFPADPNAAYPAEHGNCEVYAGGAYVELEHVAPLVTLAPGETSMTSERWFVFSLGRAALSDIELAARIREMLLL